MSNESIVGDMNASESSENEQIISGSQLHRSLTIGLNSNTHHTSSTPISGTVPRAIRFNSNVSSIHTTGLSPVREREVPNEDSSGSEDSVSEERILKRPKRINRGRNWNYFKPVKQNSIYYAILMHPEDALLEVHNLLERYHKNRSKALFGLLQFVIDCSGYQHYEIPRNRNVESNDNYSDVVATMQANPPKYQMDSGLYLFKITSEQAINSRNAIFKFISKLIKVFHDNNMLYEYDCDIMRHLTNLLMSFSLSINRSIRHTGVILLAKTLTVLLEIQQEIAVEVNKLSRRTSRLEEKYKNLLTKQEITNVLISTCQRVMEDNCCLMDKLFDMKLDILKEMGLWFKIDPSLISPQKNKYFKRLMRIVNSKFPQLRIAALTLCHDLVKTDDFIEHLKPLMNQFVTVIEGRLLDRENDVQLLAVQIFSSMLDTYPTSVPDKTRAKIMFYVYSKDYKLGVTAGEFLTKVFRLGSTNNPSESVLIKQLLTFHQKCNKDYLVPVLVESLLPSFPQLKKWKYLIELSLKNDVLDRTDEILLIEILSQAMQQVTTGSCTKFIRSKTVYVQPKLAQNRVIMDHVLQNLSLLLIKYQDDVKSIGHILEILLVIDFEDAYLNRYRQEIFEMLQKFNAIFKNSDNQELLNSISKLFALVSDDINPFTQRTKNFVSTVKESTINEFKSLIKLSHDQTLNVENSVKIESSFLKLSSLFLHHDLSHNFDSNFLLNDVLRASKSLNITAIKCGISFSFSYIMWILNNIIIAHNKNTYQEELVKVKSMADNYVRTCLQFINETDSVLIRNEAFSNIHKIYIKCHKDLENVIKINNSLKKCLPTPFTEGEATTFLECAQIILFEDYDGLNDNVLAKQQTLHYVLSMFSLKVIDFKQLVRIYQYYHSHFTYYGEIMNEYLKNLRSVSVVAISGFVIKTVLYCFLNNVLNTEAEQLIEADIELKKLVKQFQIFLSKYPEELKICLQFGFHYAIARENRLRFLSYVKYFVNSLPLPEKRNTFELLVQKVPNAFQNQVPVLEFISYFRTKSLNRTANTAGTESDEEEAESFTIENFTSDEQTVPEGRDESIIEEYISDE